MKSKEIIKTVMEKTGTRQSDLAKKLDVSRAAVFSALNAENVGADRLAKYLTEMGFTLWAVPSSIHLDAIADDAIKIDPNV